MSRASNPQAVRQSAQPVDHVLRDGVTADWSDIFGIGEQCRDAGVVPVFRV